ncbi:hypothetical protein [Proteiniclasticum sp. QWL-01]|nr:hypothetical protein [Proteiniclasticum sp. QWL-01]UUM11134.1 hypothetical protein NQU17_10775 [Clostridiaceae bacterium HFYG-1003]WFF72474.1 hypothetical protein P6M73_14520 [Proteiniclasticum sp. QWL-01]
MEVIRNAYVRWQRLPVGAVRCSYSGSLFQDKTNKHQKETHYG